ncbi:MAG: bifunctional glycosyltransferase/CDP-glycerol:glycerophosphate glycerophosphotransferase [Streptosporangiaceae bacterium]
MTVSRAAAGAGAEHVTRFSVIVPVYRVLGYLRECLDSILTQSFADLELIAVDDRSPDHCGAVLDEYALGDPRVRVLHLDDNVGLGMARQAAVEVATGEYVVFVDSDDKLAPGALRAISDRLERTASPDVLVFDYARWYWWGRQTRDHLAELLVETDPQVFSIDERPDLLSLLMVVWNKAYRRECIERHGFRCYPGYYEDLPWTYPLLLTAERIAVLDRVCVLYRQRRGGNILGSRSRKHFDVFAQYDRVFAFVDDHPEIEHWRPFLYGRMLQHCVTILTKGHRLPPDARAEFFHRAHDYSVRYRPERPPPDPEGRRLAMKLWLIAHDWYLVYAVASALSRVRLVLFEGAGRARRGARRLARAARTRARLLYYHAQLRLPLDEHLAVYAAYWFRGYACNPAAIDEKARELVPSVRAVWVVRPQDEAAFPAGIDHVRANTLRYYRALARARYLINNVNFPNEIVKRKGSVHVQTQHGTPLKTMGLDLQDYPVGANNMSFKNLLRRADRWDFNLSTSAFETEVWERAFPCRYESLESGYPRNDRLRTATDDEIARVRAALGIDPGRTAVLYTPTFRDYQRDFELPFDLASFSRALGDDYIVLVRAHYFYSDDDELRALHASRDIIDVSTHPSVDDLYLAADILLTDYSSTMFDYANLDRPIVIYAHDWDTYVRARGVYFDLLAEPPGAVAATEDELIEVFRSGAATGHEAAKARAAFRRRFCQYDDGHAAERVVRRVFLDEQTTPPRPSVELPASQPHPTAREEAAGADLLPVLVDNGCCQTEDHLYMRRPLCVSQPSRGGVCGVMAAVGTLAASVTIPQTAAAVRRALADRRPDLSEKFAAEFHIAMTATDEDFDTTRIDRLVGRWWAQGLRAAQP